MEIWSFVAGFALGVVAMSVFFYLVQRQASQLYMRAKGARGQEMLRAKEGELMAMLTEAAQAFKEAKESGQDLKAVAPKILLEVGMHHPLGAIKFGGELKKLLENAGGLEGLM